MLTCRPQSGRLGRALRAACLALLVPLSFGGCSGCDCLDFGNLNCGFSDTTCLIFCPSGGGGASSTFVGGAGPGTGAGGDAIPDGLHVALHFEDGLTPFDAVRSDAGDGYFFTGAGPGGVGVYGCIDKACARVDAHVPWGFPTSIDALDATTLWVVDAAPNADDDTARLFSVHVGFEPQLIELGGFVPHAVARGVVKGVTRLYLSGIDGSGLPAVGYSSGLSGPPKVVHLGPPLADPAALTVDPDGAVYVIENLGPGGRAALYRFEHDVATALLTGLDVGYPSGVAFDPATERLLVVVRDPDAGTTRLVSLRTDGTEVQRFGDGVFGSAQEPAGMHGPAADGSFAIVDTSAHEIFSFR